MIVAGVDVSSFQRAEQLKAEDADETARLGVLYAKAKNYIGAFSWAPPVAKIFFADGVGGVLALFLFVFETPIRGEDEALWVLTGDLPSAYFVTEQAPTPSEALKVYCNLMEEWADAVIGQSGLKDVFPVDAPATLGNAQDLLRRTEFIRREFV